MKNEQHTANRVNLIHEYVFTRLSRKAKQIESKKGKKILDLSAGNPDIPPLTLYKEKLAELAHGNHMYRYPPYGASQNFSNALRKWYKKRFGVNLLENELYPLHGAKECIALLPLVLCNPENELLIPNPGYPAYFGSSTLSEAKVVPYKLSPKNNFRLDVNEIIRLTSSRTRAIWINFPGNPTGQVATVEELKPLVRFARKRSIIILYDNAYSEITYDGFRAPSILEIAGAKEIAVEIGSFSKTFSLAGIRLGWIGGNADILKSLVKLKSQLDSGVPLITQELGAFALTHQDTKWQNNLVKLYQKRRAEMSKLFTDFGLTVFKPRGAMYLWAQIPENEKNSEIFSRKLLEEKRILITPGVAFGKSNNRFVRISLCVEVSLVKKYLHI